MTEPFVGRPLDRVDGRLKVTGAARYSADIPVAEVVYAVLIQSTITRGKIKHIDTSEAMKVNGIIAILTHESKIKLNAPKADHKRGGMPGDGEWVPLQDNKIHFNGQHIALAVAKTLEGATQAAAATKITYSEERPHTMMEAQIHKAKPANEFIGMPLGLNKGHVEKAISDPEAVVIKETYTTPTEHHNPMEPHATLAVWDNDQLTVYDTTQGVVGTKIMLSTILGFPDDKVRVVSHFLGGGFGCKGFFWTHTALAAAAAQRIGKPVKLVLTRQQMFDSNGYRSSTIQEVTLAAKKDGSLTAVRHLATTQTSQIHEFVEPCTIATKMLYATPNLKTAQKIIKLDTGTPCPNRAPGETPGTFALEVAMDELAHKLKIDPIQLRLINYAEKDPEDGRLFSGKHLKECYLKGADMFGWSRRKMEPRSMTSGRHLVGWGMATATYPGIRSTASVKASLRADGRAIITSATQDIGTGTYTIMSQIAADALGLLVKNVEFELGDTDFPTAPVSGGSQSAASVGNAVQKACLELRNQVIKLATADSRSPLHGVPPEKIIAEKGQLTVQDDSSRSESYAKIIARTGQESFDLVAKTEANTRKPHGAQEAVGKIIPGKKEPGSPDPEKYSFHSFGAQFAEVLVDPDFGTVRLGRMVGVFDVGRVLNLKTARNQCQGGMIMAASAALLEETIHDVQTGRIVTRNLADYHVPVHADTPNIEVGFVEVPDTNMGPIGARGLGEIPITGMIAAIANAVYHATGKRIRDIPIVPEKLI